MCVLVYNASELKTLGKKSGSTTVSGLASTEVTRHNLTNVDSNLPIPTVDKNGVLVKIKACGLSIENDEVILLLIMIQWELLRKLEPNKLAVGNDIAGIVHEIGSNVTTLSVGDEVVGSIPLNYNVSGCAEFAVVDEYDLTKKPSGVSFVNAAGSIGDAVKAYTALRYLSNIRPGNTVLVLNGASPFGSLVIQLCHHSSAKVICTASTDDEKLYLDGLDPQPGAKQNHSQQLQFFYGHFFSALVIDLKNKINNLKNACLEETDFNMFTKDEEQYSIHDKHSLYIPTKHDLISILAVGGHWITSAPNLQLDPPNAKLLYLRGASVSFLFAQTWLLSPSKQGRYQRILNLNLNDVMDKLAKGIIRPNIHHTVSIEHSVEALKHLSEYKNGKVVTTV
uniref:Enoyl reductase (ER) domain-containing protein n=1 Tax=Strigamia maritima TaxID=126957 RepID=T1IY46_STRMM